MKLLHAISICSFLFISLTSVADETTEKREDVSLRKRFTRSIHRFSTRMKTPVKTEEAKHGSTVMVDVRKSNPINGGIRLPSFDEYSRRVSEHDASRSSSRDKADSSVSSDTASTNSWSSRSASFKSWPSYSSIDTLSSVSSSDSSDDSSDSSKTTSTDTTKNAPTNHEPHLQYDYMDDAFINHVIANKFRYVLVGSGWSESSLGKMNINNQEKQKRAFALSYTTMVKINRQGGLGRLIYLTTAPISPSYRRYLYRLANKPNFHGLSEMDVEMRFQNFEKKSLRVVYFSPKGRARDAENITGYLSEKSNRYRQIKLPKALNTLYNDIYVSNHFVGFTAHFSGPYLEDLAKKWNLPYLVNPSAQAHWIKKSKSRQSFRDAGVRHPRGTYEPSFTIDALVDDIYALLMQLDYKKIILKLDQSAAGYGNKVMKFDEITNDLSEEEAKRRIRLRFDDREIFPEFFIGRILEKDGGAIIEEFIDCKNYASPASIYMINGLHDINMRYTYDQLLGGKDNQVFQGSLGPIHVDQSYADGDLIAMSRAIGMTLSEQGVRGNVGTDFVTCDADDSDHPNRKAWAIENNVRMTGTSYPYYTMKTLVGADKIKTKFMKSFDDVKIPAIAYRTFYRRVQREFYLSFLPKHKDTLDIRSARGCIIHNDTFRLGKLGVACLADSRKEVSDMYDRFVADVYKFVDEHDATYEYRRLAVVKKSELEELKLSLHSTKKSMEKLIRETDLHKKQFEMLYETDTMIDEHVVENAEENALHVVRKEMKKDVQDREFQQEFFNKHVYMHPAYFDPSSGTGCMINSDLFKVKHLGMVCVWNKGTKPELFAQFFQSLKDKLFDNDDDDEDEEVNRE